MQRLLGIPGQGQVPSQLSSNPKRKNPWVVSDWCTPSADEQSEEAVAESTGFCDQVEFQPHHLPPGDAEQRLNFLKLSFPRIAQSRAYGTDPIASSWPKAGRPLRTEQVALPLSLASCKLSLNADVLRSFK